MKESTDRGKQSALANERINDLRAQLNKALQEKENHIKEATDREKLLTEKANKEIKQAKQQHKKATQEIDQLTQKIGLLNDLIEKQKNDRQEIEKQLTLLQSTHDQLKKDTTQKDTEIKNLQQKLKQLKRERKEKHEALTAAQQSLKVEKEKRESADKVVQEKEQVIASLKASINDLKTNVDALNKQCASTIDENSGLKQKIQDLKLKLKKSKADLSTANENISEKDDLMKKMNNQLNAVKETVKQQEYELDLIRSELNQNQEIQNQSIDDLSDKDNIIRELKQQKEQQAKHHDDLLSKFNHLQNDFKKQQQEIASLKKSKSKQQQKLKSSQNKLSTLQAEHIKLEEQKSEMKVELDKRLNALIKSNSKVGQLEFKATEQNKRVENLEKEIAQLKEHLKLVNENYNALSNIPVTTTQTQTDPKTVQLKKIQTEEIGQQSILVQTQSNLSTTCTQTKSVVMATTITQTTVSSIPVVEEVPPPTPDFKRYKSISESLKTPAKPPSFDSGYLRIFYIRHKSSKLQNPFINFCQHVMFVGSQPSKDYFFCSPIAYSFYQKTLENHIITLDSVTIDYSSLSKPIREANFRQHCVLEALTHPSPYWKRKLRFINSNKVVPEPEKLYRSKIILNESANSIRSFTRALTHQCCEIGIKTLSVAFMLFKTKKLDQIDESKVIEVTNGRAWDDAKQSAIYIQEEKKLLSAFKTKPYAVNLPHL